MDIDTETKGNVIEFATRYLNIEKDIKAKKEDQKALKDEFLELGVPVKSVIKVLNKLKRDKKTPSSQKYELESFEDILSQSKEVDDAIIDVM